MTTTREEQRDVEIDWQHVAKHGLAKCTPEHTWAEWVADRNAEIERLEKELDCVKAERQRAQQACEQLGTRISDLSARSAPIAEVSAGWREIAAMFALTFQSDDFVDDDGVLDATGLSGYWSRWRDALAAPHNGDCISFPATCMRCVLEQCFAEADKAHALLLASPPPPATEHTTDKGDGLREALQECEEYFDQRADADQPHGCDSPIPNEEMSLLIKVRNALASVPTPAPEREGLVQATVQGNGSVTLPVCQWQPIETAPKGTKVIVRAAGDFRGERTMMARFYPKHTLEAPEGYGASDGFDEDEHGDAYAPEGWYEDMEAEEPPLHNIVPTHWMPLPVAPETEGKK